MANDPLRAKSFDREEYDRTARHLEAMGQTLPPEAVTGLAREVVKRLAFRASRHSDGTSGPTEAEIAEFCDALLSPQETAAERIILDAQARGVPHRTIYLEYIAGAARKLGVMWEDDTASFVEVTLGCGRLYRIIRGLRYAIASDVFDGREDAPAFFALVPGETHMIGIEIATDLFRRKGWDIDMAVNGTHDDLIERSNRRNYRAVVLVANSDQRLGDLTRLIAAFRITQPLAHIMVAGKILKSFPQIADITGVDGLMLDLETAVAELQALIGTPHKA